MKILLLVTLSMMTAFMLGCEQPKPISGTTKPAATSPSSMPVNTVLWYHLDYTNQSDQTQFVRYHDSQGPGGFTFTLEPGERCQDIQVKVYPSTSSAVVTNMQDKVVDTIVLTTQADGCTVKGRSSKTGQEYKLRPMSIR